jgi:iron complex outermembrane receptor protein
MRYAPWLLASVGIFALSGNAQAQTNLAPSGANPMPTPVQTPTDAAQAPAGAVGPVVEETPAPATNASEQDIVVTGSRIDRAGFTAPTPTTVIGTATLEQRAAVNVADVLNEIPSFRRTAAPESGGIGNVGANNVDLRGLTPVRTLVLLDRLRLPGVTVPGQTIAGVPDLNIIPSALLSKVDVVTGGASAAYGSDAVAGVVNLQINTRLTGLKGTLQYGQTRYDDAKDTFAALAGGTAFAADRGHLVVGFEYNRNTGTGLFNTEREWGRRNTGLVSLPANRAAGLPASLVADNVLFGTLTPGGLITPSVASNPVALRNLQFVAGANGVTTAPFDAGLYQGQIGTSMVGGSNVNPYQVLRPESRRFNLLAHVTYDLGGEIEGWVEPLYSDSRVKSVAAQVRAATGGTAGFLNFRPDNAYLQQALTPAQLALVPAGGLSIGYLGNDIGPARLDIRNRTARIAGGFRGKIGGSWRWDVNAQYSRNKSEQLVTNTVITANFLNAIDAVRVTAANVGTSGLAVGSIACRSTLSAPVNGCQPINVLGQTNPSPGAASYAYGRSYAESIGTLSEFTANINGEPFSLWAGPVSIGVGANYRRESLQTNVDALGQSGALNARTPRNFPQASQNVKEAYAEVIVPLLGDGQHLGNLDFNGAARVTDYSISGSVTTWKGGLTWKPIPDILFRGTLSRDIRAPSLTELFTQSVATVPRPITNGVSADLRPAFNTRPAYGIDVFTGGNVNLKPEIGRTLTAGVVFQPRFIPRLQFSADFYRIRVAEAIGALGQGPIIQNCLGSGTASAANPYCQLITFAGNDLVNGAIQSVNSANANFAEFKTKGLDFAVSYVQPLSEISENLPGRLSFTSQATHVIEYRASTDVSILYPNGVNRAGQTGALFGGTAGLPNWSVNTTLDYRVAKFDINAQLRYISRSRQNNAFIGPDQESYSPALFNSINNNIIPAVAYLNLGASYDLALGGKRTELYVTVNNVFDKAPPLPAINNNAYYDLLGRAYRVGVRFGF